PATALANLYRCRDGRWFLLNVLNDERDWPTLLRAIERPELASDPRFATAPARRANARALVGVLDAVFAARTWAEWQAILDEHRLTFGGVAAIDDVRTDRQMVDSGALVPIDDPRAGVAGLSRARVQALIEDGRVRVEGRARKASHRVADGERVEIEIPPPAPETLEPEPIALAIVFEDDAVLVVDKPVGMVVHPGAGHASGTLAAAVLAHAPSTAGVGGPRRPGVVHRLDTDTAG